MNLVSFIVFGVIFFWRSFIKLIIRRVKSEGGFTESKLLLSLSLLVPYCERICYRRDELLICWCSKRKNFTATINLVIFVGNVIKFITLYINPWLTNITLSCRIFIINVYMADFTRVDYIINICKDTH